MSERDKWIDVRKRLPPGEETGWFSPRVWVALKDGTVGQGECMHRQIGAAAEKTRIAVDIFDPYDRAIALEQAKAEFDKAKQS